MQRAVGGAAGRGDDDGGVLERFPGDDVARADIAAHQLHDLLARDVAETVADFVRRRSARRIRKCEADRLGNGRHGVGRELCAAGARRRAGDLLELFEVVVGHLADRMLADRLEHVLDGHRLAAEGTGQDRATVDEHRGHIEATHGHHHARQGFVAAGKADQRVVAVTAHGELDRIGDHLARGQRRLHALVAHGDAVGDRDGAELARRASGGGDALLHRLRLAHERDVAGRGLVPAGGDADEGLMDLLARQTHRVIVGAMGRALGTLRHVTAGELGFVESPCVHGPLCAAPAGPPARTQNGGDRERSRFRLWRDGGADQPQTLYGCDLLKVCRRGHTCCPEIQALRMNLLQCGR